MAQMTFLDFFSGIGGFRKGFELCGMRCVGHCEIDKYADRSYRAIHNVKEDEWYAADITKVTPADLPGADLWAAGFPCQDISVSGLQRGINGARSGLFFTLAELVKGQNPENRPTWLVLENVKNLLSIHGGWDFAAFALALVLGLLLGGSFKQYGALLKDTGVGADYGAKYAAGTAILNFAVYGLFIVLYYNLIGAKWNAATLGCVLCMVCCCFKGSHPANVWPIMVGYVAASFLTKALCAALGTDFTTAINAQAIVIGLCFANGLSPVAGNYGWLAGIVFAMLHYGLVTSVPFTHGGFLLYNGGFTAGLICTLFIPVMEVFFRTKQEKSELKAQK